MDDLMIHVKAKRDVLMLIEWATQGIVDQRSEAFMLGGIAGLNEVIELLEKKV